MGCRFAPLFAVLGLFACNPAPTEVGEDAGGPDAMARDVRGLALDDDAPSTAELPLTPESFCAGTANALAITTQDFAQELAIICNGSTPTPAFRELLASAYNGVGNPKVREINARGIGGGQVQTFFAYATHIRKAPVPAMLEEEALVLASTFRGSESLFINASFFPPDPNPGDCDTAFAVQQLTTHDGRVEFYDVSKHDLKIYRLYPDNFNFLMAVRTMRGRTTQFSRAVVIRGAMANPDDPTKTIGFSLLNMVMKGHGREGNVIDEFKEYIYSDARSAFVFHNNRP